MVRCAALSWEDAAAQLRSVWQDGTLAEEGVAETAIRIEGAIAVASPALYEAWFVRRERDATQRRHMSRYVARMGSRATPFGWCSGVGSLPISGMPTRVARAADWQRRLNLDGQIVQELFETTSHSCASTEPLLANDSVSEYETRLEWVEARTGPLGRSYSLVGAPLRPWLAAVLREARRPTEAARLVRIVCSTAPDVTTAEAEKAIAELCHSRLLVPAASPFACGGAGDAQLTRSIALERSPRGEKFRAWRSAKEDVEASSWSTIGGRLDRARRAAVECGNFRRSPVHGELILPEPLCDDAQRTLTDLGAALEVLRHVCGTSVDPLSEFRAKFLRRFGDAEVSLERMLNAEQGLELDGSSSWIEPLLLDLTAPPTERRALTARDRLLLARATERDVLERLEWDLSDDDVASLWSQNLPPPPESFAVMLFRERRGEVDGWWISRAIGPSALSHLGRFSAANDEIAARCRVIAALEQASSGAVIVDLAHLPLDRHANVVFREPIRNLAVRYLAGGAAETPTLRVDDLFIAVREGRVVLRSRSLDREVRIRQTNAHAFGGAQNPPMYRFLGSLQGEGSQCAISWDWGCAAALSCLPRVRWRQWLFAPAQWRLDAGARSRILQGDDPTAEVRRWCSTNRVPRQAMLVQGDDGVGVDMDSNWGAGLVTMACKESGDIWLREKPTSAVADAEGLGVAHEIVVAAVRTEIEPTTLQRSRLPRVPVREMPGGAWLYGKLYAPPREIERRLANGWVRRLVDQQGISLWFITRFWDPDHHLRLRCLASTEGAAAGVRSYWESCVRVEGGNRLWRLTWDTYDRETERYGGCDGLAVAERLFHVDSDATLRACEMTVPADRWRVALLAGRELYQRLALDLPTALKVIGAQWSMFAREFEDDGRADRIASRQYRERREEIRRLFRGDDWPVGVAAWWDIWKDSFSLLDDLRLLGDSGRLNGATARIAASLFHMHVNRLFPGSQRPMEFALCGLLRRSLVGADQARVGSR